MPQTAESKLNAQRWQVLQPAIYLISLLPGLFLSVLLPSNVSKYYLALTTLSVILIQHGINVLNDAIDWEKGADSEKLLSWVRFHATDLGAVKAHGGISFILGIFLGSSVVILTQRLEVFYLALPLVALGYSYNASQWTLSYTALGEWVTGLCYGPGVFGCMGYLFLNKITPDLLLGSLAFGCLAVAVLFSHQPAQIFSDFLAGKSTFAVRNGQQKTILASRVLNGISLLLLTSILLLKMTSWISIIATSTFGLFLIFRTLKEIPSPGLILKSAATLILLSLLLSWGDKYL